jgi:hypothetical protein
MFAGFSCNDFVTSDQVVITISGHFDEKVPRDFF